MSQVSRSAEFKQQGTKRDGLDPNPLPEATETLNFKRWGHRRYEPQT
jgi:hypothetical protein